jgi:hypothetical protein
MNRERKVGIDEEESERSDKEIRFKTKRSGKVRKRTERNGGRKKKLVKSGKYLQIN